MIDSTLHQPVMIWICLIYCKKTAVAMLEEIGKILQHMLMTDSAQGSISDSVPEYVAHAINHLMKDSIPLPIACDCHLMSRDAECHYHMSHLQFFLGYPLSMISVDMDFKGCNDGHGAIRISTEGVHALADSMLYDETNTHHEHLRMMLTCSASHMIMQCKDD